MYYLKCELLKEIKLENKVNVANELYQSVKADVGRLSSLVKVVFQLYIQLQNVPKECVKDEDIE